MGDGSAVPQPAVTEPIPGTPLDFYDGSGADVEFPSWVIDEIGDDMQFPESDMEVWGKEWPRDPRSNRPVDITAEIWRDGGLSYKTKQDLIASYPARVEDRRKAKVARLRMQRLREARDGGAVVSAPAEWFGRTRIHGLQNEIAKMDYDPKMESPLLGVVSGMTSATLSWMNI